MSWKKSIIVKENLISYFPLCEYDSVVDLAEIIMNPANCRSSTVIRFIKDNINFIQLEPVYFYTYIIKPNLIADSCVRLLTSLHFPSDTGYRRFVCSLYKPVEHSYINSISIRVIMKTGKVLLKKMIFPP